MVGGGPLGTEGAPDPGSCMTGPNFLMFVKFFINHDRSSKDSPNLNVLDDHKSHITIESINFCKDNGIHVLTIPPHTSQKLQHLDRKIFGSMKSYYKTECNNWMASHPGRPLTIYDLASCSGNAYPNAMNPKKIQESFTVTVIYPFNPNVYILMMSS